VLVHEAGRHDGAALLERREVGVLGDDLECEGAVHLEPLEALAPLRQADVAAVGEGVVAKVENGWKKFRFRPSVFLYFFYIRG
jgi:hypothetical protein